jgi:4-hydroxy-3-methylbut-2-enyl diphosphate reductase
MKIIRAKHLGMCFGVKDAIALAIETAKHEPLTILGDLVHNEIVLADLRAKGIRIEQNAEKIETQIAMITAHGASEKMLNTTRERGLKILEATCPLVHAAHRNLKKLVDEGFYPIVIGKRDHVEVRGLTEDLSEFDILLDDEDVEKLSERPRFGIISQTTQKFSGSFNSFARVFQIQKCVSLTPFASQRNSGKARRLNSQKNVT